MKQATDKRYRAARRSRSASAAAVAEGRGANRALEALGGAARAALETGDIDRLVEALGATSRLPAREAERTKARFFRELGQKAEAPGQRPRIWEWTRLGATRPEREARQMACALLDLFWRDHRRDVERITLNLSKDEDGEVRRYALGTIGRIVRADFARRFRYLKRWCNLPDPAIRRQMIISVVAVADSKHPEWAAPLLDLLEAHLGERDPYVRANLGPVALGHGMLGAYPRETLQRLLEWCHRDDEIVRWNVAMAFTSPFAGRVWKEALEILGVLCRDPRRFVWEAAASAMRNLVEIRRREVEPVLRRWMVDPETAVAAANALTNLSAS